MRNIFISFVFVFCLLPVFTVSANDSSFFGNGETLQPLTDTPVELAKEVLKIRYDDGCFFVTVDFEFENPGPERLDTVGFVAPSIVEFEDADENKNDFFIKDFHVEMNGQKLAFKKSRLRETPFSFKGQNLSSRDHVLYFQARFLSGLNTIHHTYTVPASGSIDSGTTFFYRITTGKNWAKKTIKDFTMIIEDGPNGKNNYGFGDGSYFWVPNTFLANGIPIDWQIEGVGQVSGVKKMQHWFPELVDPIYGIHAFPTQMRLVRLLKGSRLVFHAQNFRPDYDFHFGQVDQRFPYPYMWEKVATPNWREEIKTLFPCAISFMSYTCDFENLTDEQLRLHKNLLFAWHGAVFSDKKLNALFSRLNWYIPNPNQRVDVEALSDFEREELKAIQKEERRRKTLNTFSPSL